MHIFQQTLVCAFFLFVIFRDERPALAAAFDVDLVFSGIPTDSQSAVFAAAAGFWERYIYGYQPDVDELSVEIQVNITPIDGVGTILGQAGPTAFMRRGGFWFTTRGRMMFDSADVGALESRNSLFGVVVHEMAHVLGFGTLWRSNGTYVQGSGCYTGEWGLDTYKEEFGLSAGTSCIPVELDGGGGTANAHWDEGWAGGRNEVMTGYFNPPTYTSRTSVASFADMGYKTTVTHPIVPLPSAFLNLISAILFMGGFWLFSRSVKYKVG